jgi:predicted RNA-binding protein with RPS1 domain
VLSVDKERKKIALSIKRAEVDPWTTVEQRYQVGQLVQGTITKIAPFGAFARIEDGVEGLIHLSEMPAGTQDPKNALREGQEVTVRVVRIEPDRRRLGLSIRQASDTAPEPGDEGAAAARPEPQDRAEAGNGEPVEAPRAESAAPAQRQRPAQPEVPATAMAEAFRAFQQQQQATRERENGDAGDADSSAPIAQAPTEASDTTAAESAGDAEPAIVEQAMEAPDVDVTLAPDTPASSDAVAEAEAEAAWSDETTTPQADASQADASQANASQAEATEPVEAPEATPGDEASAATDEKPTPEGTDE